MRRYYFPLAILILLTAAVLRLWQLPTYPPGPHYDEGAYLLITRSIAFGGAQFFPIVEAYQGREVLYMYLNAPLLHLWGDRIFTLHLTSAFASLIMVAASMSLARAMFRGERGVLIALAAGIVAVVSFPQLFLARQAFRAVTLPTMQALALLMLWRALNRVRQWGWFVGAGVFAGGVVYTYNSSRLFPFWLALVGLALIIIDRRNWRLRLKQGAAFFGTLGLVAAPMAIYALQKPDIFWGRLGEVTLPAQSVSLWESIVLHARMFFIEGDPYLRYNVPHRPYFTWPEGLLLILGCVVGVWRVGREDNPNERVAYALLLLSPLMVLPSVVSVGGLPPSHMRSMAMIPLAFVLVAVGAEAAFVYVRRRLHWRLRPGVTALGLACLTLTGGIGIGQVYFSWAARADLFYETDADLSLAARWLADHTQPGDRVYLAAKDRSHPTVMIEQTPPITWLGTTTLFRAPIGATGLYVFPRSAPPPDDWRAWLEPGRISDIPLAPDGRTAFEAFRLPGDVPLPPGASLPQPVPRSDVMILRGTYARPVAAGSEGEIVTVWEILRPPSADDLTPLIQLEDAQGAVLSRSDVYMTDTRRWEPGSILFVRLPVRVPPTTPPVALAVRVAWVEREDDHYASYRREDGTQGGIWASVGTVGVARPDVFPHPDQIGITQRVEVDLAGGIRLIGYDPAPSQARPGEPLPATLYWQAMPATAPRTDHAYRIELVGESGQYLLDERTILRDDYPPSRWVNGEVLAEHVRWPLPRDAQSGTYTLRLRSGDADVLLGTLDVRGIPRSFDAPVVECTMHVDFGGRINLIGYTRQTQGEDLTLTLVWQAQTSMDMNYTVFVHLVDTSGSIIAQSDAMPLNNTYPTTLWSEGEYVTDSYVLTKLAPDGYIIRVGIYDPVTGLRLPIEGGNRLSEADYVVLGDSGC